MNRARSVWRALQRLRWFAAFAFDWVVIVGCFIAARASWGHWYAAPALLLILFILGGRQHAIAVLGHDGSHRSIVPSAWWNDVFAWACFLPIGGSLHAYRRFHAAHHAHVGTPRDTELEHLNDTVLGRAWDVRRFWRQLGLLMVGGALPHVVKLMKMSGPQTLAAAIPNLLFFALSVGALVWFGLWWVLVLWYLALGTTFWLSFHLRIFTEHFGAEDEHGYTHVVRFPWWARAFSHPHNIGIHEVHHADPSLPFYRLPALRTRQPISIGQLAARLRSRVAQ